MTEYVLDQIDEALLLRALAPRPLAWVTTRDEDDSGLNMAPFSAVTIIAVDPPTILLVVQPTDEGELKRSARNILESGEFIINVPSGRQLDALMRSADPAVPRHRRVAASGTTTAAGSIVKVDRLAGVLYALECSLVRHETLLGVDLFFATVVHLHTSSNASAGCQPFLGALGYEWFVSEAGVSFVSQPYLRSSGSNPPRRSK